MQAGCDDDDRALLCATPEARQRERVTGPGGQLVPLRYGKLCPKGLPIAQHPDASASGGGTGFLRNSSGGNEPWRLLSSSGQACSRAPTQYAAQLNSSMFMSGELLRHLTWPESSPGNQHEKC